MKTKLKLNLLNVKNRKCKIYILKSLTSELNCIIGMMFYIRNEKVQSY